MDANAYDRVSKTQRAAIVSFGVCSDMAMNFPLWICSKRIAGGIRPVVPPLRDVYKGSGSLLLAYLPMLVVEDRATAMALSVLDGRLGDSASHLASACFAGAVGGACVGAQFEGAIMRAHATETSVAQAVAHSR